MKTAGERKKSRALAVLLSVLLVLLAVSALSARPSLAQEEGEEEEDGGYQYLSDHRYFYWDWADPYYGHPNGTDENPLRHVIYEESGTVSLNGYVEFSPEGAPHAYNLADTTGGLDPPTEAERKLPYPRGATIVVAYEEDGKNINNSTAVTEFSEQQDDNILWSMVDGFDVYIDAINSAFGVDILPTARYFVELFIDMTRGPLEELSKLWKDIP